MKTIDTFNKTTIRINLDQAKMIRKAIASVSTEGLTIQDVMCLNGLAYEIDSTIEEFTSQAQEREEVDIY